MDVDLEDYPNLMNERGKRMIVCLERMWSYLHCLCLVTRVVVVCCSIILPLYYMDDVDRFRFFVRDIPEIMIMFVKFMSKACMDAIREVLTSMV